MIARVCNLLLKESKESLKNHHLNLFSTFISILKIRSLKKRI